MLHIRILTVGKPNDTAIDDAISVYTKRLRSKCKLDWEMIPTSDIEREGAQIIARVRGAYTVLLDESGDTITSKDLASRIEKWQLQATGEIVIVIGGAFGVAQEVKQHASETIALSRLTFPHQLVRLIIAEQLYRGYAILSGSNYHHE